jgi:mono/diheme cytochrome c family protein
MVVTIGMSSWKSPGTIVYLQQATPTLAPVVMSPTEDSWIIVDLPEDATQLEYGAEVYRLVCKACHGDKGQGLTEDWRAQWAPSDQNCWQSKCHGGNHPSDGFYMPQVPAVLGQPIRNFGTALNLYNYTHAYMPWHDRGSMTQKESWSVTAYLLKINGIDPPPELNAENAANIDLSVIDLNLYPTPVPPSPEAAPLLAPENTLIPAPKLAHESQRTDSPSPLWIVALVLTILFVLAIILVRRRSSA